MSGLWDSRAEIYRRWLRYIKEDLNVGGILNSSQGGCFPQCYGRSNPETLLGLSQEQADEKRANVAVSPGSHTGGKDADVEWRKARRTLRRRTRIGGMAVKSECVKSVFVLCICMSKGTCICMYTHVQMYACRYVCKHVSMCACMQTFPNPVYRKYPEAKALQ